MRSKVFVAVLFVLIANYTLSLQAELKSTYNQADYIVIYHPEFQESIQKFVQWREDKGVNVYSVDVNEIYREFQDTNAQVDAIRDFVSYALEYWSEPKPRYLLLVGGINHIPSKRIESPFNNPWNEYFVNIDDYIADNKYNDDTTRIQQDLAIGRFPVRNIQDLDIMIEKTIMFEDSSYNIQYKNDFLISADRKDYQLFESFASNIIDNVLPEYLKVQRFDYREDSYYYGSKEDFIKHINDGAVMLVNFFHGVKDIWMYNKLLNSSDVDSLTFTQKPFIINAISCSQHWDDSTEKGIIEKFLCKPRSGAVACFASNGLTYGESSFRLVKGTLEEIVKNGIKEFGTSILVTKNKYYSSVSYRHTLLGDPMLKIPNRIYASADGEPLAENNSISIYPNPCVDYAVIRCKTQINSKIEIIDMLGNKIKAENISNSYEYFLDTTEIPNGTYFVKITNGFDVLYSKFVVNR